MTVFNRIVVIFLLLALIPIVTVGLLVPREATEVLGDGLDRLEEQLPTSVSAVELFVRIALALLIDSVLIVLLYLQVGRRARKGVPVPKVKGGHAQIAVESVVERLVYHIDRLPGVLDVKPTITPHRRGVEVVLEVEAAADVNLPDNIEEISTVARRVIEDEMGLMLKGKPKLNLRTVAEPRLKEGAEEPLPYQMMELDILEEDEETTAGDVDEPGSTSV